MPIVTIPNWGLGLNADAMPSELPPGYCNNVSNMRFRNGYAERIGGQGQSFEAGIADCTVIPYWIGLFANSNSSQGHYHIHAGIAKVFADNFALGRTEITRYTDGKDIVSMTAVGTLVTVTTATAHGRSNGDALTVYAALPVEYNTTTTLLSTGANTFTYVAGSAPATPATYVGAYSYNVQADFTGAIDDRWTGFSLNGIFFLNNPKDGLYFWNGDTATRLRKAPGSGVYVVARAFKNYVFWIKERSCGWSSATEPGSIPKYWASGIQAGNDSSAGVPLAATNGVNADCLAMGDTLWIYARDARIPVRWTNQADSAFSIGAPLGPDGVRGVACVVDTPKGHVFLTQNYDVKIHSGGEAVSLAEGRVRSILATIDVAYRQRSFLVINPQFNEVWVCCCISAAIGAAPNRALIWNWKDDTWGSTGLDFVSFGCSGLLGSAVSKQYMLMCVTGSKKIYAQDDGYTYLGVSSGASMERVGLSFGNDDTIKNLSRSKPNIESSTGGVIATVSHGSTMYSGNISATYSSTTPSINYGVTTWCNAMATGGRFLAWKIDISGSQAVRFSKVAIDFTESGSV